MNTKELGEYTPLFKVAFYATIAMLVIIPTQVLVFVLTKLPETPLEWFELFDTSVVLGLFHADFFILMNNILISVIYLAFYHSLKDVNKSILQVGLMLGLIGIAAYISSNKTFELLALARQYAGESDHSGRLVLEAAAKASLAGWQGTAFDAYYVLNGIALFIFSILMYRSPAYGKATATWGLAAAVFMIIPSTAGMIGLIFSLLSLVPWYVFGIRFAVVFRRVYGGKEST